MSLSGEEGSGVEGREEARGRCYSSERSGATSIRLVADMLK